MTQQFDVVVVGGGIVGLAAALSVAQRGHRVAVIDAGRLDINSPGHDPRVYAINHASRVLLHDLGAWQHLDQNHLSPYRHMHVWDSQNDAAIDFDCRDVAQPNLGFMIEEFVLKAALLKAVSTQSHIHLFPGTTITEVTCAIDSVAISSLQDHWEAKLLMIADGARSPVRDMLKVGLTSWPYHQHALVATVHTELPHHKTAYQVFHPEGPLAFLPLRDEHLSSIVWSNSPQDIARLMAMTDEEFHVAVTKAFANKLGQVTLKSPRAQFPLVMRHVKEYVGPRWLLLGDAAHTIHPLAGLGLNLGLADVRAWMNQMEATPKMLFSKKSLGAYQRERKNAVWQMILILEGLKRIFGHSSMPIVSLRGLGLRCCNQLDLLKRLFIEHAAG